MNLYNVKGGSKNYQHHIKIKADSRKQAIVKFMDLSDETYHENILAELICKVSEIVEC